MRRTLDFFVFFFLQLFVGISVLSRSTLFDSWEAWMRRRPKKTLINFPTYKLNRECRSLEKSFLFLYSFCFSLASKTLFFSIQLNESSLVENKFYSIHWKWHVVQMSIHFIVYFVFPSIPHRTVFLWAFWASSSEVVNVNRQQKQQLHRTLPSDRPQTEKKCRRKKYRGWVSSADLVSIQKIYDAERKC